MVADTAICNFSDDTSIFAADCFSDKVLERLESDALVLSTWSPEKYMKLNKGKCHLLTFGKIQSNIKIKIVEAVVEESSEEKLLGIILDKKRNFKSHISSVCKKASQKLHALARASSFMDPGKLLFLMNSFINAQFSYCPLMWMFQDRNLNAEVNEFLVGALRIDTHGDYEALLKPVNAVSVHQHNLRYLMIEIYRTKNSLENDCLLQTRARRVLASSWKLIVFSAMSLRWPMEVL